MNREFILGATVLILGGLILATAITGTTGSLLAVFLAPGALNIKTPIAGTFRSAGNIQGATPGDSRNQGRTQPPEQRPQVNPAPPPTMII